MFALSILTWKKTKSVPLNKIGEVLFYTVHDIPLMERRPPLSFSEEREESSTITFVSAENILTYNGNRTLDLQIACPTIKPVHHGGGEEI